MSEVMALSLTELVAWVSILGAHVKERNTARQ